MFKVVYACCFSKDKTIETIVLIKDGTDIASVRENLAKSCGFSVEDVVLDPHGDKRVSVTVGFIQEIVDKAIGSSSAKSDHEDK